MSLFWFGGSTAQLCFHWIKALSDTTWQRHHYTLKPIIFKGQLRWLFAASSKAVNSNHIANLNKLELMSRGWLAIWHNSDDRISDTVSTKTEHVQKCTYCTAVVVVGTLVTQGIWEYAIIFHLQLTENKCLKELTNLVSVKLEQEVWGNNI